MSSWVRGSEDWGQMEPYLALGSMQSWEPYVLLCTWPERCTQIWALSPPKSRGSIGIVLLSRSRSPVWNSSCKWSRPLTKLTSCHSVLRTILSPRGHLEMSGDIVTTKEGVLLASNGWRPGMLLNISQCKNFPDPNIDSATMEEPWGRIIHLETGTGGTGELKGFVVGIASCICHI